MALVLADSTAHGFGDVGIYGTEAGPATCAPRAGAGEENPPLQRRPRPQAASRHGSSPKTLAPPTRLNHTTCKL